MSLANGSNVRRFDGGFDKETVIIDSSAMLFLFRIHEVMVGMSPSVPLQDVLLIRKMEFSMHATKNSVTSPSSPCLFETVLVFDMENSISPTSY